jgi:hypothetical protein
VVQIVECLPSKAKFKPQYHPEKIKKDSMKITVGNKRKATLRRVGVGVGVGGRWWSRRHFQGLVESVRRHHSLLEP